MEGTGGKGHPTLCRTLYSHFAKNQGKIAVNHELNEKNNLKYGKIEKNFIFGKRVMELEKIPSKTLQAKTLEKKGFYLFFYKK